MNSKTPPLGQVFATLLFSEALWCSRDRMPHAASKHAENQYDSRLAARVRRIVRAETLQGAARSLGVSRAALLAVAAEVPVRRGTLAVVRAALAERRA